MQTSLPEEDDDEESLHTIISLVRSSPSSTPMLTCRDQGLPSAQEIEHGVRLCVLLRLLLFPVPRLYRLPGPHRVA